MSIAQNKQRIAVLAGGYSGEAVISLQSAATVMEHLDRSLFDPILVRIDPDRWWADVDGQPSINKSTFAYTQNDIDHSFDAVFIMVHGTPGEDGILQKYFENLSIPFTTGSSESVTGTFNKFATTTKLRQEGFTVGNSVMLNSNDDANVSNIEENVGFPCFVKPNQGGSSLGISRVEKIEDLHEAIDLAKSTNCESIIIESLLKGREFSMGVVPSEDGTPIAMPITEIVTENLFFDYQAKYEGASDEITPADITDDQKAQIQSTGIAAYKLLGCRGMVRLDYILVEGNKPAILEVNTVPGFSKMSILPQQLAHCRISINEMLTRVLNQCSN